MPSNPPTIADLEQDVATECGLLLAEAGVYLLAIDTASGLPTSPVIRKGLRMGCKCVGLTLANSLVVTDADVVGLSTFASERVVMEATLYSLEQALLNWWKVGKADEQEKYSPTPVASGWRAQQKQSIVTRIGELKGDTAEPYREPTDPVVVMGGTASRPDEFGRYPFPYGYCEGGWL